MTTLRIGDLRVGNLINPVHHLQAAIMLQGLPDSQVGKAECISKSLISHGFPLHFSYYLGENYHNMTIFASFFSVLYRFCNIRTRLSFQQLPIFRPFLALFSVTLFGRFCKGLKRIRIQESGDRIQNTGVRQEACFSSILDSGS